MQHSDLIRNLLLWCDAVWKGGGVMQCGREGCDAVWKSGKGGRVMQCGREAG